MDLHHIQGDTPSHFRCYGIKHQPAGYFRPLVTKFIYWELDEPKLDEVRFRFNFQLVVRLLLKKRN